MNCALQVRTPWQKALAIALPALLLAVYTTAASRHYLAARYAGSATPEGLRRAGAIEPWDASIPYRLGLLQFFDQQDFDSAARSFERATALDSYNSSYWLKLAASRSVAGDDAGQRYALEKAVWADRNDPAVGLEAAGQYLADGNRAQAFELYRTVLSNRPAEAGQVLPVCLRAAGGIEEVLAGCVPDNPEVYAQLLKLLVDRDEGAEAASAWDRLAQTQPAFETAQFLPYMDYLLGHNNVSGAVKAWGQVTAQSRWSAYRPDSGVVNGSFENPPLNGGFDWRITPVPNLTAAITNQTVHEGTASFEIGFQGPAVADTGISEIVPVTSGRRYRLEFFYRCEDLETGSGPRVQVSNPETRATLFLSDEMLGTTPWRQVAGEFTVGPEEQQVEIRVVRTPGDKLVKGTLWLDDFSLKIS